MQNERARDLEIGGREATEWASFGWVVQPGRGTVIEWGDRDSNGFDWAARLRFERGRMVFESEDVPVPVMRALAERILVRLSEKADPTGDELLLACGYRYFPIGGEWRHVAAGIGDGER